jgi:hypothetical protein
MIQIRNCKAEEEGFYLRKPAGDEKHELHHGHRGKM